MLVQQLTREREILEVRVDLIHIRIGELDHRAVLPDPLHPRRAGDRDDDGHPGALRQAGDPVDGELRGSAALPSGPLFDFLDQLKVGLEVLGLVGRPGSPDAALGEVLEALDLSRQDAVR